MAGATDLEQYQVTRHHGTERAFTGKLNKKIYDEGTYHWRLL